MFDFLETDDDQPREKIFHHIEKDIPETQRLFSHDLKTINPNKSVINLISSRILKKYLFIPLFIVHYNEKPFLPKHLDNNFWYHLDGENTTQTLYIALENPFDMQILNIVRNITKYSVMGIPADQKTLKNYLKEIFCEEHLINKKEKSRFSFTKDNFFYLITLIVVITLLISLKFFLEKI